MPGFPRALSRTMAELRLAGVGASELRDAGELDDLAELVERAAGHRRAAGAVDYAEIIDAATDALEHDTAIAAADLVVLLDVSLPTAGEQRFVKTLARIAPMLVATVPEGDEATRTALAEIGTLHRRTAEPDWQPGTCSGTGTRIRADAVAAILVCRRAATGGRPGRFGGPLLGPRRGARGGGDRAAHSAGSRARRRLRRDGGAGARAAVVSERPRARARARRHRRLVSSRHPAARSRRPRPARAHRLRGRRSLGTPVRGIRVAGPGADGGRAEPTSAWTHADRRGAPRRSSSPDDRAEDRAAGR